MTPRLRAAFWAGCSLLLSLGCAQQVSSTDNTTTTSGTGATGAGGTGGAATGGTTGSGATMTVPPTCMDSTECSGLSGPCSIGDCIEGQCVAKPINDFKPCDDGDACTKNDQCGQAKCSGQPIGCGPASVCHINKCNPATGMCEEVGGDDGAQCDDGDPCTYFGTCSGGVCSKGSPVDCSLFDTDCTVGSCDPVTGCKATPAFDGFACDDGQFCTINETCSGGVCGNGSPMPCAPPGGCFIGTCDELNNTCSSAPGNDGNPCDDASPCTAGTTCSNGACIGGTPANEGAVCDDGTSCTTGEHCIDGACGGGAGPVVYFSDDFADNAAGWVLGPEWQIGPAKQGFTMGFGPDPEDDHSATADDGVAGVVIGGDASNMVHDYSYIESPTFDTSGAVGPIILGYYRWLNSDGDPSMHNRVEVWNGNQWITIWASGQFFFEGSWNYMQHDITNYKNAAMRVRFGFDVKSASFASFSGWNLDDVLIASQACP